MARADRVALAVAATRKETRFPRWVKWVAADAVADTDADTVTVTTVTVLAIGRSVAV